MTRATKRETVNWVMLLELCTALSIKIDSIVFLLDLPRRGYSRKNINKKNVAQELGFVIECP